jgi:hypothetical protein
MLAVFLVVVLDVVLLSYCFHCLQLLYCRIANTAAANTTGTLPLLPPPLVGVEIDACYTNTNSSAATLSQIERRKKTGTKIHHDHRRPPNTNKMQ